MTTGNDDSQLSALERTCLALAARGRAAGDIAHETDLSPERVEEVLRAATDKLGARNLTGAISRALRLGLL